MHASSQPAPLNGVMILCFAIGALWDGITTAFGIATIINATNLLGYAMCLVGAVMIAGFGLGTRAIFAREGTPFVVLRLFWFLAIIFDVYTALIGNARYVVGAEWNNLTLSQGFVVGLLTLLVSGSPVFIGYLLDETKVD